MTDSGPCLLIIFLICEVLAFILCVSGNLVVCYVMIFKDRLKNSASMYILSTSTADLLVGVITIPFAVLQAFDLRPHGFVACSFLMILTMVVTGESLTSMIALSVGRFWAICFPFSYRNQNTRRVNAIIIGISWIIPVLTVVPLLFDLGLKERFMITNCTMMTFMNLHMMRIDSISQLVHTSLMILLYFFMYRKLSEQRKNISVSRSKKFRADVRIAKTFAMVYGAYVIFWTPALVFISVIGYMGNSNNFTQMQLVHANLVALCLIHFNSALNPLIYAYRIESVRETIKKFFCRSESTSAECSLKSSA